MPKRFQCVLSVKTHTYTKSQTAAKKNLYKRNARNKNYVVKNINNNTKHLCSGRHTQIDKHAVVNVVYMDVSKHRQYSEIRAKRENQRGKNLFAQSKRNVFY